MPVVVVGVATPRLTRIQINFQVPSCIIDTLPSSLLNDLGSRIVDVNQNALLGKGDFGMPELILVSVIAPFVEEFLKPVGLIFILKRLKTPYEDFLTFCETV